MTMWARLFEIAVGGWLLFSPTIFIDATSATVDRIAGALIILFALASLSRPLQHAHLLTTAVALWLIANGLLTPSPAPPSVQNSMLSAMLVAMLAVIPTRATSPPDSWQHTQNRS